MDNYIVSARKYRPDSFESVVGQDAITQTLKNSIKINQLAHAYLFCGPRGVGKTTCARIFAKTINCNNLTPEYEACNECESCVAFNKLRSLNIHELDAASNNSVEDIRNLIDQVRIPPQLGSFSVYIIDEVHMLSSAAFNAFLKTLEEPPKHVIFILATTEKHKIIPTILSRCQIFDFNRIRVEDIRLRLEYVAERENIVAEEDALHIIAQKADGAMRDALSIFDQIVSFCGKTIDYESTIKNLNVLDYDTYFSITEAFLTGNFPKALLIFDNVLKKGFEGNYFINGLASHFRDLLICKDPGTIELLEVGQKIKTLYLEHSQKCSVPFLFKAIEIANQSDLNYKQSQNKRLLIELALLNICKIEPNSALNTPIVAQVAPLEKIETKVPEIAIAKPIEHQKVETPVIEEKKPIVEKPTNVAQASISPMIRGISIRDMALSNSQASEQIAEEKKADNSNIGKDEFTQEKLNYVWTKFAESLNENPRLHTFLTGHLPEKSDDGKYIVKVSTQAIKGKLEEFFPEHIKFVRAELNNSDFNFEYVITEDEVKKTFRSDEEKLQDLIELNPDIKKLRDQLNLDFE